jgi:hypothetical protein
MIEHSNYHKILRIASVVCALVLVFQSGLISKSTNDLARGTETYLANAVGVGASVEPTALNQMTAQLTEKEQELAVRESALREREIEVGLRTDDGVPATDPTTYLLASILFILLVLIVLNYVLDYLRSKERAEAQPV